MTIVLSPEVEKLVRERVQRGEYDSPDALVGTAVPWLIEDDREEDAHREDLLVQIDAAEAEIDRDEYVEYDADTIHELAKDTNAGFRGWLPSARRPPRADEASHCHCRPVRDLDAI